MYVCITLFSLTSIHYMAALTSIPYSDKTRRHNAAICTHTCTLTGSQTRTYNHTHTPFIAVTFLAGTLLCPMHKAK